MISRCDEGCLRRRFQLSRLSRGRRLIYLYAMGGHQPLPSPVVMFSPFAIVIGADAAFLSFPEHVIVRWLAMSYVACLYRCVVRQRRVLRP